MSKLNAAERKAIPASKFGLPAERKYPMEDRGHERAAMGRATQQQQAGRLSPEAANKIRAKARRLLGAK